MRIVLFLLLSAPLLADSHREQQLAAEVARQAQQIRNMELSVQQLSAQVVAANEASARSNAEAVVRKNQNLALANEKRKLEAVTNKQATEHSADLANAQDGIDTSVALNYDTKALVQVLTTEFSKWRSELLMILLGSVSAIMLLVFLSFVVSMAASKRPR